VIHADLPTNKQTLLHRSGRTGRAGRKGISLLIVPANRVRAAEGLMQAAGVSAFWGEPPLAEEVFARDGERLLADPCFTEETTADDAALGRALLEGRSAEDVAAALVRLYRARLPAPEEISVLPSFSAPRRSEGPRHEGGGASVWFSMNVGRAQKADPKWLLPMICRMGGVEKREIGAIRILDRETRFEIFAESAEGFVARLPKDGQDEVRITRAEPPPAAPRRESSGARRGFKPGGAKAPSGMAQAQRRRKP